LIKKVGMSENGDQIKERMIRVTKSVAN